MGLVPLGPQETLLDVVQEWKARSAPHFGVGARHPVLNKYQNIILEAAVHEWPSVPKQKLQQGDAFLYAVCWAYALDKNTKYCLLFCQRLGLFGVPLFPVANLFWIMCK